MIAARTCGEAMRYVRCIGMAVVVCAAAAPSALHGQSDDAQYDTALYEAMRWRNIGPFRGGRSVAATGVTADPFTYYFGGTGGGVWKTEDAGESWTNISDGFFKTGSVGAIAVAESDPNVIYVGMGEHAVRGVTTSHGDGVYRSTDAGKTWTHIGLERTRVIARIRIHPQNPDLVYVAAQGATHGATPERGVYRSRDGGANWERVLFVSASAGASELSMDLSNPRILYAGFWDHLREPWKVTSGGPGSGIWKSVDGGDNWEQLTQGLPEVMGKTAVDASPVNPELVWALVEAEGEKGGLYRSDDAGKSWRLVNSERTLRARAWYYIEVYADPQDENTVYVMNAPFHRSVDGGKTFTQIRVPHGDQHDLWINPKNNQVMINANDGGANVTFNGGKSWSTQRNQPTAQFYRVNTDNRFPYYVYAGQQDNSTVATASRTAGSGIGWKDWHAVGGGESAHISFDPDNPVLVFAGSYQGTITEYDDRTKTARAIMAYPFLGLSIPPLEMKYRFNWNAPIVVSAHDPGVIYHAANVLLKSEDRGRSWVEASPDLTRDEKEKQGRGGGPFTNEAAGGENYNTIMYVAESPHEAATIWVGSDDGLVHVTRDGGANWANVTPRGIGEAIVNSIEASPHDPATAYIAVTRYKFNDLTPYIYRTSDYGGSWKRIVRGIADEAFVRVVREDPVRRGLLYAGTETGMYVSFDDGERWQSLGLNLPAVPITDLKIQDNDLVAATQGRAFWILDDLAPLQQIDRGVANSAVHLFTPERAYRFGGGGGFGGNQRPPRQGENPPAGAAIYFYLAEAPESPVRLEILNGEGEVIRTYSSEKAEGDSGGPRRLEVEPGQNRAIWDLRYERITRVPGLITFGGMNSRRAGPGTYQVRLSVGDVTQTRSLEVVGDPRLQVTAADYQASEEFLAGVDESVNAIHEAVVRIRNVRGQMENVIERVADQPGGDEIREAGESLIEQLDELERELVQPDQKTFQDVINFANRLNAQLFFLSLLVEGAVPPPTAGELQRLADLSEEWSEHRATLERLLGEELAAWNEIVRAREIPAVITTAGSE